MAYTGAADDPGHGVWVENGSGNAVRQNSIHDNVGLGIELGTDGVTANDPGDGDTGANGFQNFPVLVTVTGAPAPGQPEGGSLIQGVLHSSPSTSYAIDAFSNPACVRFPKDFLEGQTFLGSGVVTTDGTGTGAFSFIAAGVIAPGEHVSVTATDPAGNTSEFSQRLPFSVSPASWTLSRMPSIESSMVPLTVQLIVAVAGLCSSAPALEVMRPAGIAPRRSAHRKSSYP